MLAISNLIPLNLSALKDILFIVRYVRLMIYSAAVSKGGRQLLRPSLNILCRQLTYGSHPLIYLHHQVNF